MAVFAKFFIAIAYACVYVWTVELFPTFIRLVQVNLMTLPHHENFKRMGYSDFLFFFTLNNFFVISLLGVWR
jgi:hypothetical protein